MQLAAWRVSCNVRPSAAAGVRPFIRPSLGGRPVVAQAAETGTTSTPEPAAPSGAKPQPEETVFYEGDGGSPVEFALSLALTATLIFAPLTIASIGRRLWIKYKFTNKRLVITNTSPLFKSEVQVAYSEIKEIRCAPRGFDNWGDMVIFLKNGNRLELIGMGNYRDLKLHIERCLYTI